MLLREKTAASVTLALSQCYNYYMRSRQTRQCKSFKVLHSVRKKTRKLQGLAMRMSRQAPDHVLFSRLQEPGKKPYSQLCGNAVQLYLIDSSYIEDCNGLTNIFSRGVSRFSSHQSYTAKVSSAQSLLVLSLETRGKRLLVPYKLHTSA